MEFWAPKGYSKVEGVVTMAKGTNGMSYTIAAEEANFCDRVGLEYGFDKDSCDPQRTHICWPSQVALGALCQTEDLWCQGGQVPAGEVITCADCVERLMDLMKHGDNHLLTIIGRLASRCSVLQEVSQTASEYLWAKDHPKQVLRFNEVGVKAFEDGLRNALRDDDAHWAEMGGSRSRLA